MLPSKTSTARWTTCIAVVLPLGLIAGAAAAQGRPAAAPPPPPPRATPSAPAAPAPATPPSEAANSDKHSPPADWPDQLPDVASVRAKIVGSNPADAALRHEGTFVILRKLIHAFAGANPMPKVAARRLDEYNAASPERTSGPQNPYLAKPGFPIETLSLFMPKTTALAYVYWELDQGASRMIAANSVARTREGARQDALAEQAATKALLEPNLRLASKSGVDLTVFASTWASR